MKATVVSHISLVCFMVGLTLTAVSCSLSEPIPVPDSPPLLADIKILLKSGTGIVSSKPFRHIDSFVYDSDSGMLDSCQQFDDSSEVYVHCTSGDKRIVLVANAESEVFNYDDILTYEGLCETMYSLSDEDPHFPVMSGEITAGKNESGRELTMELTPLLSRIVIGSFRVDFSSRPYRNLTLEHEKVYLTNVCGRHPISGTEDFSISEIINHGCFDRYVTEQMRHPEMLISEQVSGAVLYCYPCKKADGPGQCSTRLVIEGEIGGETYYYPIDICEESIERGVTYRMDITITGTGCTDPDTPAVSSSARFRLVPDDWENYEENVPF